MLRSGKNMVKLEVCMNYYCAVNGNDKHKRELTLLVVSMIARNVYLVGKGRDNERQHDGEA